MQALKSRKTKINSHILDLFLSLDLSDAALFDGNGEHIGFNTNKLEQETAVFLSHLHSLGVDELPSVQELIMAWRKF